MLELLQGTVELLILRTLAWGPQHGFGVAKWIKTVTHGKLDIDDGALYPALHRMEHRKLIAAEWRITDSGRRARYYALTPQGRKAMRERTSGWADYVGAMDRVIKASTRTPARARG